MTVDQLTPGGGLAVDAARRLRTRARARRPPRPPRRAAGPARLHASASRADVDPSAVVFASRAAGENWFCFEQPDRDGSALAALGTVTRLTASGADRFERVAAAWRELTAGAVADAPDGPPGAGLVALGGFAFAPDGGHAPHWSGFEAADLIVPEVALARRGDDVRLTLAALAAPDDVAGGARRAAAPPAPRALRLAPLPLLDPAPAGRFRIDSVAPPEHYEAAVARAVERIRAGAFEKIVLAREVTVQAPTAHDAAAVFGVLRGGLPVLLRLLRRPRRRRLRRRLARAADPPRRPPRPDRRARRLHPPLRRPRRRRPPRRAAAALRQGPRGAGDRRPPHRPRAAPARRLGRRARRADADQGREHPAPRHPDPRPARATR